MYIEPVTDDQVHLETTSFVVPYLGNPNTTVIDTQCLDNKNYGTLYIVPVTDDLVHPETTPTNKPSEMVSGCTRSSVTGTMYTAP